MKKNFKLKKKKRFNNKKVRNTPHHLWASLSPHERTSSHDFAHGQWGPDCLRFRSSFRGS